MSLLRKPLPGRKPAAAAPVEAPIDPKRLARKRAILTAAFVAIVLLGWMHQHTVNVAPPEGAYVDEERGFAIVVPRRWKVVDRQTVTYLKDRLPPGKEPVVTLISDFGQLAPTVAIRVVDDVREAVPSERGIAEFESGFRTGWTAPGKLDLRTDLATVDGLRAFHMAMLATVPIAEDYAVASHAPPPSSGRMRSGYRRVERRTVMTSQQVALDQYFVSGRNRSYTILAVMSGAKREEVAKAARAVADGFRVLERPRRFGGAAGLGVSAFLGLALIVVIWQLSRTTV